VTSKALFLLLLAAVAAERLAELAVSRRNVAWSFARGGREYGKGHYPLMVTLHVGLLVGSAAEVLALSRPFIPPLGWPMLALVFGAEALRFTVIRTLGPRWTTRVIVIPGHARIRSGPFRFVNHPNYVAVVVEGFALPLVHSAWLTAALFSAANLPLLGVRIRCEEQALREAEAQGIKGASAT
jgi:methyltransferase